MIIFQVSIERYPDLNNQSNFTAINEDFHVAAGEVNKAVSCFCITDPNTNVTIGCYYCNPNTHYFIDWLKFPCNCKMPLTEWLAKFGDIK